MRLMYTTTYPISSMDDTVKVFVEGLTKNPMPDFVEQEAMYVRWGGKGLKVYAVYNVTDGNVDEGVKAITRFLMSFGDVEGYKVKSAEVIMTAEDALTMVGEKMP
jgi:hypothetical protein